MSTNQTTNARLYKPSAAERHWDVPLNANADFLDGMSAIGRLLATPAESPSTSLNVRVTAGAFLKSDGTLVEFSGAISFTLPASTNSCLWLSDAGELHASAGYPSLPHVRLARASTGPTSVTSLTDERVCALSALSADTASGGGGGASGLRSLSSFVVASSSGLSALTVEPEVPALGFFGVAPESQAPRVLPLEDGSTGLAADAVGPVGSIPIDNNFATLAAKINALIEVLQRHGLMGR